MLFMHQLSSTQKKQKLKYINAHQHSQKTKKKLNIGYKCNINLKYSVNVNIRHNVNQIDCN